VHVARLDGAGDVLQLSKGTGDQSPTWSRDGRFVYYETTRDGASWIARVPATGGPATLVLHAGLVHPEASPRDDALIVYEVGATGRPLVADLASGRERPLSPAIGAASSWGAARFSPDGARALVIENLSELVEVEVATGRVTLRYDASPGTLHGAAYTPDGLVVAQEIWSGNLWLADGTFP
jgi:hypothetical protein